jgi:hypothetical protein
LNKLHPVFGSLSNWVSNSVPKQNSSIFLPRLILQNQDIFFIIGFPKFPFFFS